MQSGYKTITPIQLANAFFILERGEITHESFRVYLACFVMVAVREAAARHAAKRRRPTKTIPCYRIAELARVTAIKEASIKRALKVLKRIGLVEFAESQIKITKTPLPGSEEWLDALSCRRSSKRPIPVPRSLLRFLAQNRSATLTKTALAYVVRGLSLSRHGDLSGKGTAKVSWISCTFNVSERAVNYARARLIEYGWIDRDRGSVQRKLNRTGAYFSINLDWKFLAPGKLNVQRDKSEPIFAPPPSGKCPVFAPPYKYQKTSIESKNQKTHAEALRSGFCLKGKGEETPPPTVKDLPPATLKNIRAEDFQHLNRLEELFFQAAASGWITGSEASALDFIAAAVKAREVGCDPVRLFVAIVRRRLWHHINQAQEERARVALLRSRTDNPARFRSPQAKDFSIQFAA